MQCGKFEMNESVKKLYEKSNAFLNSLFAGEPDEWNLYMVKLRGEDEPYMVKIMSTAGSRGIVFYRGGDCLTSLALMRDAASMQEMRGLLCESDCFVCMQYDEPRVTPDFQKFASGAGVEAPLRDHLLYFFHPAHRGTSFLKRGEPELLHRIVTLCMEPEDALEDESVTRLKIPEGLALRVIYSVAFDLPPKMEEAFAECARKQKSLAVQSREEGPVYEVDFHFASYKQEETGRHREDVAVTVVSREKDKLLFLDLAKDGESLFVSIVRSIWMTLHEDPVPAKIVCTKNAVFVWLESICDVLGVPLEMVPSLESTERRLNKIRRATEKRGGNGKCENVRQA